MPSTKTLAAKDLLPELKRLESCVGEFMHYWGFKKVHGRIWVHLYTSKDPLDSEQLMLRLGLSKGMMSIAIRELVDHQVILSDHVGKHGVTYYRANPDIMAVITRVLREREMVMLAQAESACRDLLKVPAAELTQQGLDQHQCENVLQMTDSAKRLLELFTFQMKSQDLALFDDLTCQSEPNKKTF
jgi:DNA-binding transcriptional regulator GbsR (MarR family)